MRKVYGYIPGGSSTPQVQSDWNEANPLAVDFIKNKPTIPASQIQSDWNEANPALLDFIKNKPTIPAAQIQSDWNEANPALLDFIKNKPTIPTVFDPTNSLTIYDDWLFDQENRTPSQGIGWASSGNGVLSYPNTTSYGTVNITSGGTNGNQTGVYSGNPTTLQFIETFSNRLFDLKFRFRLNTLTNVGFALGLISGAAYLTFTRGIALVFDTSLAHTQFMYFIKSDAGVQINASGINVDSNFHSVRIRCIVAGTILFSIDGGVETAVVIGGAMTTGLRICHTITTFATANQNFDVDYSYLNITGLSR